MSSNNKESSVFCKRKSKSPQKAPSRTPRRSQKDARKRSTTRTHLPRKVCPPFALKDKGDGGSPTFDDLIFYSREDCPESRNSRPISSVEENEWLNLSGVVSHPSKRTQSAASDWNTGDMTSNPSSAPTGYNEQNAEPAPRYKNNLQEESDPQTQEEFTDIHHTLKNNTSTIEKNLHKGPNQSFYETKTDSYEELTQRSFETEFTRKSGRTEIVKPWKLDRSLVLSSEFAILLAENNPESKHTAKCLPDIVHDTSFPPLANNKLSKYGGPRSASLPSSSLNTSLGMFSTTSHQASQRSGRSCQIRLPPPPEEPQTENVSDEDLGSMVQKRVDSSSVPLERAKRNEGEARVTHLRAPRAAAQPPSSTRTSRRPQNYNTDDVEPMAIRWASTEFLAARVVSELNSAFTQTFLSQDDKPDRGVCCVTPTLMARSNSLDTPRINTFCLDKPTSVGFSSIQRGHSKSLSSLPASDRPTRRVFVTFDSDFPRAAAVNLQGKSEVAARCRKLNRNMNKPVKKLEKKNPGIKLQFAQTNPVQKTVMIRNWVESCSPRGVKKRTTKFTVYTKQKE